MKTDRRHTAAWIGLAVWSGLLTAVTYGTALHLPFFFDDFVHIPFVDAHSLPEMWQTAYGLAYYRPLAFTLWKLMYLLLGYHSPFAQHALNLLAHLTNGLMVAWLAGHLWTSENSESVDWRRLYLSATLFLLYPFSYQAVPWAGSLAHPLVTTLVLLSLANYLKMRATGNIAWGLLGLAFAFLSPFAHENGALIGPLIAAIELTRPPRPQPRWRIVRRMAAWLLPTLIWLPIWWLAPKGLSDNVTLNSGEALLQNAVYFAQGIAYPFTWPGGWLRDSLGVNDLIAAGGLSALALTGAALAQWRSGADRRAWLPWLWCGLAAVPVILFLRFDYVINGPRLLMLTAVGAAWLWTDTLIRMADWGRVTMMHRRVNTALAAGLCLAVLAQNHSFIRIRMDVHEMGSSALRQAIAATTAANEAGQPAIFINLPAWIAPMQSTYALGHEGVQFLPGYVPPETLASVNTGRLAILKVIRFDEIRPSMPYLFGLRGQAPDWHSLAQGGGQVFVARYGPEQVLIQPVGELAVTALTTEPIARFGAAVTLWDAAAMISDARLELNLTWQVHEPPLSDVTLFAHVLDAGGQLIAQADGDPLAGSYPFWRWPPGSIARDRRSIDVSGPGLSLRVGLYNRATGERLTATSTDETPWADNAVSISIRLATNRAP